MISASSLNKDDLLALLDTANQLNSVDTLQDALTHILTLAGNLSGSQAGSVLLHDQARNDLYFAAATGPVSNQVANVRVPIGKGKAGQVFTSGKPLIENRLENHYEEVDKKTEFSTKSMICLPLIHKSKKYGVIQVLNKAEGREPYGDRDVELLTLFATQATIAIRNATLFEQMLATSGLYAAPEVRQDLIQSMTASGRSAIRDKFTVLFADMRGFSQLCNMVSNPEKIQGVLSDYVLMLSSTAVHHAGIVNKVLGDGLMVIFRGDAGVASAVRAAFEMLDGFERLRAIWNETTRFNLSFLDIGIGITTDDEMILGTIGDDTFRDFTVIGPAVNLAGTLVKAAREGNKVLCDNLTMACLKNKGLARVEGPTRFTIDKLGPLQGLSYDVYSLFKYERPEEKGREQAASDNYDVFFSYRREGGSDVARSVQQALKDDYRIFLDVDRLPSGHFDNALLRTIEVAPNFVVFLSQGSLDRCNMAGDWLRREIAHAIKTGRNIVPVTLPEFVFPDPELLPEDIREIGRHDAVEYSHRYFYAMLDKIREHLM